MEENAVMELAVVNRSAADPIPAFVGTLPADLREQMWGLAHVHNFHHFFCRTVGFDVCASLAVLATIASTMRLRAVRGSA
jgi:hypothetical protein